MASHALILIFIFSFSLITLIPLVNFPSLSRSFTHFSLISSQMARTKNPNSRKGKKPASLSNPPSPSLPQVHLFNNDAQKERYFTFFDSWEVLEGRFLDLDFLTSIYFPYITTFEEFGWLNFLKIHRCIYEDVVKAFYSNANDIFHKRKSSERFKTNIGSTSLEVNTILIHNRWGIPLRGENFSSWTQDFVKACQEVYEDDTITTRIKNTTRMSLNTRILHLICCKMLVPRHGSFASISNVDLWLMQCIMAKRRPNLCILLINQMIDSFSRKNRTLPYGMAISDLLDK